ncbi:ATP-binding protein [Desulfoscipio geothermicus]|uniref:AAA+-type ATPase, SpoVK/Ycf46/Vps4 family n=1 Tax=Desulfoscipio geothermicus DSM 3669 TaxID=1121426 RepID=A0A1I6E4H3_9FIRM|nr:ATP-binding protein [Desulfoscipio geothermicus]SFR12451.1 AAA+-type ATPase, SpoVK/Ycf46/Vps4 family [Desulfoscipio geothermicus DSM 3669]
MQSKLVASRDIIICYNRSAGITFPIPSHRKVLLEELGFMAESEPTLPGFDEILPRKPAAALAVIEAALRLSRPGENGRPEARTAVIVDYAEMLAPAADLAHMSSQDRTVLTTLQRWAVDREIITLGSPVFLITENLADVHPVLRSASSRIEAIQVPLPDTATRETYITGLCEKYAEVPLEGITVPQMARLTAGLKRLHLEDIFLRAEVDGMPVTSQLVKERKRDIIASEFGEVLQIIEPETDFSHIGGMEHIKNFFRRSVIKPLQDGNSRRCPMGILLPGPAGTGKTILAEAVAKESGINCCMLNLGKIMDKWVGSSEANLDKALQCIEALSPTIVIVDEIDQSGLSRDNSGDSGVSNRLFKRLLEFMSDTRHRGSVVFVGLTNRPDKMDAALKRPGRFDKKVPVLPPEAGERADIFRVMLRKYQIENNLKDQELVMVAEATEGYTGAEIEALVLKASEVAEDAGVRSVDMEHLRYALDVYRPTTRDIEVMTRLALEECNDLDLLPPAYREKLAEKRNIKKLQKQEGRQRRTM